jgi:hypothetical protein
MTGLARGTARFVTAWALAMFAAVAAPVAAERGSPPEQTDGNVARRGRDGAGAARRNGAPAAAASVAAAEQLFDRYVLGQARAALGLGPAEMRAFTPRLQQLQRLQRQATRQRQQGLAEIARLTRQSPPVDEGTLAARLEQVERRTAEAQQRVLDARQALEQTLTIEQRARFRVFEQRMERRKLELIARARAEAQVRGGRDAADGSPADEPAGDGAHTR